MQKRTLLLSFSYEPLMFINCERALVLSFKNKAEVLHHWDNLQFSTVTIAYKIPSIVRLLHTIPVLRNRRMLFSKKLLFCRDDYTCQYCMNKFSPNSLTVDHIVPKCDGGLTTWLNCVASCSRCNRKKANLKLHECGLQLNKKPHVPNRFMLVKNYNDEWHPCWDTFINS